MLQDAGQRLDETLTEEQRKQGWSHPADELTVYSWPQRWSSTSCGFGGIAGQAITTAQTFVVGEPTGSVVVYHSGRFAYLVRRPNATFKEDFNDRKLVGARDYGNTNRGMYEEE
jgi:hypothetical protein